MSDRYEIQKQLSNNAGRRTFVARDLVTQKLVIVKLLTFGNGFEWDHLKLFEREAKILQTLSHPAIPKYLNYFDLDLPNGKGFALVQTNIDAQSLDSYLEAGPSFSLLLILFCLMYIIFSNAIMQHLLAFFFLSMIGWFAFLLIKIDDL